MFRLEIACPKCGQRLKLPDLGLLGRKARCGKCGHKFILQEPPVPPENRPVSRPSAETLPPPFEFTELAEIRAEVPRPAVANRSDSQNTQRPKREPRNVTAALDEPVDFPSLEPNDSAPFEGIDLLPAIDTDTELLSRRKQRTPNSARRHTLIGVGVALGLAGITAAWFFATRPKATSKPFAAGSLTETIHGDEGAKADSGAGIHNRGESPTNGRPLTLRYVPMGARIVVHLRPAELWGPGSPGEEFRACLGPLGVWLDDRIRVLCLVDPATIEEVLFALIPESRESFEVAAVVKTRHDVKRSELLEKINGELVDQPRPHYVNSKNAYLLPDARTIAIAPRDLAGSMLESIDGGGAASEGIQALLPKTDRDRHFTLLAELEDVRIGRDSLAPANARALLTAVVDFFGDNVETIATSVHLGDADKERGLFAQVFVRNRLTRSPTHLRDELQKQLARLPADMLQVVYRTNPGKLGEKKIVGRFPIMTKVLEQSSVLDVRGRIVTIESHLPERAGPNLALGALLTWNQTTLPDYGQSLSSAPTVEGKIPTALPATIAERLQKKMDVEFRDDFLYVAVAYIGEEIGVEFKLDGTGMKRAGVTQNEKQKFEMNQATASAILDRILTPRKLVLIVDEQKKIATITGAEEAADKKLQPFPLTPSGGK